MAALKVSWVNLPIITICLAFMPGSAGQAEVVLDGTLGRAGPLPGPHYQVPAAAGKARAANLFHSFEAFNVGARESVTFEVPDPIQRIIGRITGGDLSRIDGQLTTARPVAELWLINPAGVELGKNAKLDVEGALRLSTADFIAFEDGIRFNARDAPKPLLSSASPVAFGFLAEQPADIVINARALEIPLNATLSLVGGDLTFRNVLLVAFDGRIELASVGSRGRVNVAPGGLALEPSSRGGTIAFSEDSFLEVLSFGSGRMLIRSGQLVLETSTLAWTAFVPDNPDLAIDIEVEKLWLRASDIRTLNLAEGAAGSGGNLRVAARQIDLSAAGTISASSDFGLGGDLLLIARDSLRVEGTDSGINNITSDLAEDAPRVGNVRIEAGQISLVDGGMISTEGLGGAGGSIDLRVRDLLTLANGAISTNIIGSRNETAGDIDIAQPVALTLVQGSRITANAVESLNGRGRGGNIRINADTLLRSPDTTIRASAALGIEGRVDIAPPDVDLSSALTSLPARFFDAAALLSTACARRAAEHSRLVVRNRPLPADFAALPDNRTEAPRAAAAGGCGD
ncbi:MAG: filamentous hemagglutinin N-terminal domain-containing protein [Pseudomonadota bacterium]|nr:filamentous hemagglutinin N-terminal domain-containing protein [Pseudomonadota bacterium]